ncbi:MAG: flagellar hook-associated protein FlgK [Proteobacteria bacterium]|nr:flagellar hook-associated protein FlgK [Pseudomonadota bacterium]
MSISGVLSTAVTGLFATQAALRTTANNIVNVNTKDYSREVVHLENIVVGGRSAGVKISDIQRIVDRFLQAAGLDARARASTANTEDQFNQRFQSILGRPDSQSTISARINRLFGVIADLAIDPAGQILRQATLASMQDMADEITRVSGAIQNLRNEANQQIQEQVVAANEALARIHEINPLIVRQRAIGGGSAGLDNRRDQALNALSEIVDIRISRNGDGSIGVTTGSGTVLLDSSLRELEYNAPGLVTSGTQFDPIQIWRIDNLSGQRVGVPRDFDHKITNGKLRGLLNLRDNDLRDMSLTLGELSATLIDQINAIHNAHTSVPAPNQLVGREMALPGGQFPFFDGIVNFAIVDSNNQVVQKISIDFDQPVPPAPVSLNDIAVDVTAGLAGAGTLSYAGNVMTFTATDPTHGVVILDDPVTPSERGSRGFSHFFGMNDLLAAAVPASFDTGLTAAASHLIATGTTTFEVRDAAGKVLTEYTLDPGATGILFSDLWNDLNGPTALGNFFNFAFNANGALEITPQPGNAGVRLSVVNDTTNVGNTGKNLSFLFGIGDRFTADAANNMKVVDRIAAAPIQLALATFDLTAAIGTLAFSAGDQSGAAMPIVYVGPGGDGSAIVARHEAGIVVPPADPEAFAAAVRRLFDDREAASRFAANSLAAAPEYSREIQARKTLATLEKAVAD